MTSNDAVIYRGSAFVIEWYFDSLRIATEKELSMKKNKAISTYDREMTDPKFRGHFLKEYNELALSELILAMMAEDNVSVRKLAREVGLAPSVIQSVRSGRHSNLTLKSFLKLIAALGGELAVKKGKRYISVKLAA